MTKTEFKKNYKQVSSTKWVKRNVFARHSDIFIYVFLWLATSATLLLIAFI